MHRMTTLPTMTTFLSRTTYKWGNLPLQCWCSPSCHNHLDEPSRPAGEKEGPEFSWIAKSWLPAWFSLSLAAFRRVCESLWRVLLMEQTLISLSMSLDIPPEQAKWHSHISSIVFSRLDLFLSWTPFPNNTTLILITLSHLATKRNFSFS